MSKRYFFILLMILFLISSTLIIMENGLKGKIVCFGDSITHGALVEGNGWVELLDQKSDSIVTVNAGRNGRKTSDKFELLPVLEKNKDADYFLLLLGVNDLKDGNDSLVTVCVNNMRWMIAQVKEKIPVAKIILMAPCSINLKDMSELNRSKKYNQNTAASLIKLETCYKELAEKEGIWFISLLHTVSSKNYVDGLHPNSEGHKEIADKIWEELNKLFRQ
jgi:lysophospholipase L1-like esterase